MTKRSLHAMKRPLALLLSLVFLLSLLPAALAADYSGHWAESSIEKAVKNGWFSDGNNTRPGASITRAEFVTMINRMKGFSGSADLSAYPDVKPGDWYYDAFSTAVANGYIEGSNGKLNPNANITRNEAVTIFTRIGGLNTSGDYSSVLAAVPDAGNIPSWAAPYAGAAISNGLIGGSNGLFNGNANITRAETAVLLERLYDDIHVYGFAGTYTGSAKSAIVQASGVTLKGMTVSGNLTIDKAVGNGEVTLDGVKVGGKLDIQGGGMNSVYIIDSDIASIVVTKDEVRTVSTLTVAATATGTTVATDTGSKIGTMTVSAAGTEVTGAGTITTANIKAPDVVVESKPDTTVVDSGLKAEVGGSTVTGPPATGGSTGGEHGQRLHWAHRAEHLHSNIQLKRRHCCHCEKRSLRR